MAVEYQIAGNNRAMRETFIVEIARGTNNPWLLNGGQMSENPTEDLLVVMLDLEAAGATDEIKSRALAAMTRIGWTPKDSTGAWSLSLASAEIRYNSWGQPVLSTSGRSLALTLEAAQTRLPPRDPHPLTPQTPWEFFEASFEPFRRVAV